MMTTPLRAPSRPNADGYKHLLLLQPRDPNALGEGTPLFFLPGAGGGETDFVQLYARLIRHMGGDRPVYGFVATGLANGGPFPASVEHMSAAYVAELCTVQPAGPYLLAGEDLGGRVAFEMARQLIDAGEDVALFALLNSIFYHQDALPHLTSNFRLKRAWHRNVTSRWRQFRRIPISQWPERLRLLARNARTALLPATSVQREAHRTRSERWAYVNTLHAYKPATLRADRSSQPDSKNPQGDAYVKRVVLLVTSDRATNAAEWQEHVRGQVVVRVIPGDRLSYLAEHAGTTAACLRTEMNAALA